MRAVAPLNCSGDGCSSYFMPGLMSTIVFDSTQPSFDKYPEGRALIQDDAPGYQVEFSPVDSEDHSPVMSTDCRVYGINKLAIQICLKSAGNSFIAGNFNMVMPLTPAWKACPYTIADAVGCLNSHDWQTKDPFYTKMTIFQRRASAVFNPSNFTILDVIGLSDPVPTNYSAEDFFFFYNIIFAFDENQENYITTIQYSLLDTVVAFLGTDANSTLESGALLMRFQEFLATPVLLFNNVMWPGPTFDMGKSVTIAMPSYMVLPVDHIKAYI